MQRILAWVSTYLQNHDSIRIAIDGRCAGGKTTLAAQLQEALSCQVFHMDDFFLRPAQRTAERLAVPGENVDHERFLEEILQPWAEGKPFAYRPYDCATQSLQDPVPVTPGNILVVEGSYSCHPALWRFYDLHIFLDVEESTQMQRILVRNGPEALAVFAEKWIPLEEAYFSAMDLRKRCDMVLKLEEGEQTYGKEDTFN